MTMSNTNNITGASFNTNYVKNCCTSPSGAVYWIDTSRRMLSSNGQVINASDISYDEEQDLLCTVYQNTMWFSQGTIDRALTYTLPANQINCLIYENTIYMNNYKVALVSNDVQYDFNIPITEYTNNMVFKMQATNEVGIEHNYININNLGAKLIDVNMIANGYYDLIYDITSDNFKMLTSTKIVTGKYVGNGNYQTKTEINVGFEPDVVFVTSNMLTIETTKLYDPKSFPLIITSQGFTETLYSGNYVCIGKHSLTANGFSISNLQYSPSRQDISSFNANNIIYSYVAIKY